MEVLDQQVGAALPRAEQRLHLIKRSRVDLPALWVVEPAPPPGAGVNAPIVVSCATHDGLRKCPSRIDPEGTERGYRPEDTAFPPCVLREASRTGRSSG